MKTLRHLILLPLLCLSIPAQGWDTRVEQGYPVNSWLSIYQAGKGISIAEHTSLSDLALRDLGLHDLFGRKGKAHMTLVDLNASLFRRDTFKQAQALTHGDQPATALEERRIPQPAMFSGIPDYSYTIYDWLNKNVLCPAVPDEAEQGKCHVFALGWLGDLNAVHFGSQAKNMYAHYHWIALGVARRARELRESLQQAGESTYQHHKNAVRELELLALGYEGYAQHFLQDRWAIGHMWERWSATDFKSLPNEDPLLNHAISGISGLLHGSEAVTGARRGPIEPSGLLNTADPLSSPIIRDGKAVPMQWAHQSKQGEHAGPYNGIGDERLNDSQILAGRNTGYFGAGYYGIGQDYPFSVMRQRKQMMKCSKAGWAEVVRDFGENGDGYGYGSWGARLGQSAPNFNVIDQADCWDMWATNESLYTGLVGDPFAGTAISASELARMFQNDAANVLSLTLGPAAQNLKSIKLPSDELVALKWRMWRAKRDNPQGTELARGGMGALFGFEPGQQYPAPSYQEPLDFMQAGADSLPDQDPTGRDKQTLFGTFNQGFSAHWCRELPELLEPLRASSNPVETEACHYIASLAHHSTLDGYQGSRVERLLDANQQPVSSLCHVQNEFYEADTDANPLFLQPGYVEQAQQKHRSGHYQSVVNWCAKTPLLKLDEDPELRNADIVATLPADQTSVYVEGLHLGEQPGQLKISHPSQQLNFSIDNWTDTAITLKIDTDQDPQPGDYRIEITRADGTASVGQFLLRVESPQMVTQAMSLQITVPVACEMPQGMDDLPVVDFAASIPGWQAVNVRSLKRLRSSSEPFWNTAANMLREAAECIDKRRQAAVPAHFDSATNKPLDFPDKAAYDALVHYDEDGREYRSGPKTYFSEMYKRGEVWRGIDNDLYAYHAQVLRLMSRYFARQPAQLQDIIKQLEMLSEQHQDTPSDDLHSKIEALRQSSYEQLFKDYRLAPAYMAYLVNGLKRWSLAERKLLETILPYYEQNRQYRLQLLTQYVSQGEWGCVNESSRTWGIEVPVDMAASTPAFGLMLTYTDLIGKHLIGKQWSEYPAHEHMQENWLHDWPQQDWVTPQRLQAELDWQPAAQPANLIEHGCQPYIEGSQRFYDMASFRAIYGEHYDELMGMGPAYEALAQDDIGDWLSDRDGGFSCLRCDAMYIADMMFTPSVDEMHGDNLRAWGDSDGIVMRTNQQITYYQPRKQALQAQLAQCRQSCMPSVESALVKHPGFDAAMEAARRMQSANESAQVEHAEQMARMRDLFETQMQEAQAAPDSLPPSPTIILPQLPEPELLVPFVPSFEDIGPTLPQQAPRFEPQPLQR